MAQELRDGAIPARLCVVKCREPSPVPGIERRSCSQQVANDGAAVRLHGHDQGREAHVVLGPHLRLRLEQQLEDRALHRRRRGHAARKLMHSAAVATHAALTVALDARPQRARREDGHVQRRAAVVVRATRFGARSKQLLEQRHMAERCGAHEHRPTQCRIASVHAAACGQVLAHDGAIASLRGCKNLGRDAIRSIGSVAALSARVSGAVVALVACLAAAQFVLQ